MSVKMLIKFGLRCRAVGISLTESGSEVEVSVKRLGWDWRG
jgi:hypothetical protein